MTASDSNLAVALLGFTPTIRRIEAAGLPFECRTIRDKITMGKCTLPVFKSSLPNSTSSSSADLEEDAEGADRSHMFDAEGAKYTKYLMKLDPNDTKNQDHYKVLGLSKLRFKATMAEIRTAYRKKVLMHHPDKKKHRGEVLPAGEDYFTCITKAYEQLGMSEAKRQAYDSVDHKFNDAIPTEKSINKDNFISELGPVFELNGRWSSLQPVPKLGKEDAARADVEAFYNFWFDFKSWREFSYLDEEDKERGEDRYERREMEKINKAERERRRKEEGKRIRKLVEMAYAKDPRIAKFKKEDQDAKTFAREERQRIQREKAEAIEREKREKEEAEKRAKEEEAVRLKAQKEKEKKEREILKKAAGVQRRRFKKLAEQAGHWAEDPNDKLKEMERVERLCLTLPTDDMSSLCDRIESLSLVEDIQTAITEAEEAKRTGIKPAVKVEEKNKENEKAVQWTSDEIQLLVKASNTFPPGTVERWVQMADYINEHRKDRSIPNKNEKQVIRQSKAVQAMVVKLPTTTQNNLGTSLPDEEGDNWEASEQKLLEESIRKHPSSDPDRWDKISADVGTKSKKACIRRFKHLVQMVKNNKK